MKGNYLMNIITMTKIAIPSLASSMNNSIEISQAIGSGCEVGYRSCAAVPPQPRC